MKWVVTLVFEQSERIEDRVLKIVEYLTNDLNIDRIEILNIDATGTLGNKFTHILNEKHRLFISKNDLISLLKEDGQLIDFETRLSLGQNFYLIIISDGNIIDVVSDFIRLPNQIIGSCIDEDPAHFLDEDTQ